MTASPSAPGWSLRRRLVASFAVLALVIVAMVAVFGVAAARVLRLQDRVTQTLFTAITASSDRFEAALDQETAVRGFALTGDDGYLQPYSAAVREEAERSRELEGVLAGEPRLLAASRRVEERLASWRREVAVPMVADVRRAGPGSVTPARLSDSRLRFDDVRAADAQARTALAATRAESAEQLRAGTRLLRLVFGFSVLALVVSALLLGLALRRWVVGPLERLRAQVRTVRDGSYDTPVTGDGPPEVVGLGADVDAMRRAVVTSYATAVCARQEAEVASRLLEEQAQELRRSNAELEQFAYVASHDLQEPLRKVASFCQMLERRYKGQLDERADTYIAFAVDGAKRMQQLINDLLGFSRVGRVSAGLTDVDLEQALATALRNLAQVLEDTAAVVTHDPLPTVSGEAGLLSQVFQNLIGNAVKFRGADVPRVHIGCVRRGGEWEICCTDNGIGVQAQYAERIFVIFQRLHPKDEYEGTGIGLALCRKIVEHHGGRIWLDTDTGPGATFRLTLPVAPVTAPGEAAPSDSTEPPRVEESIAR